MTSGAGGDLGRDGQHASASDLAAAAFAAQRGEGPDVQAVHRTRLQQAQRRADLTLEQLWLRYFALGGDAGLVELEAYLAGLMPLPVRQRDMLAHAVNEHLDELLTSARVPYSHVLPASPDAHLQHPAAELTGLVSLLTSSHLAAPSQLPALTSTAYRALGVEATMYLADHDQRLLVPMTTGDTTATALPRPLEPSAPQPLSIDATLAGRAFRHVQTLASDTPEQRRLWLPLLDGTERLGVLEVRLSSQDSLVDGDLRVQCEHLARLLGHLVTAVGGRGDALDAVRRTRPRTPSAELVWQLLPPQTAETDAFALSGWLEPADVIAGDTFDYALSPVRASLAVFDAMGHGLPAGLMAAAAVSAYRAARRNGHDLLAQAQAIDTCVSALSPDGSFVTGFLGELDLTTGRLAYLSAGHPQPLLLRSGKVVRTLTGGRRLPFGLDSLDPPGGPGRRVDDHGHGLGREDLEPGDWLVVHTDGVTEARNADGEFFGDARLADFLQTAAAAGRPPPETARRLAHAVLAHQHGHLQDDATVLLSCWQPAAPHRLALPGS